VSRETTRRARLRQCGRTPLVMILVIGLMFAAAGGAFAFFTASTSLNVSGTAASLSAPTAPTATPNSPTAITIGWTLPGSQLTGAQYRVSRTSPTSATVCTVASNVTSCQDTGLTAATSYSYSIKAIIGTDWQSTAITPSATTLAADGSGTFTTPTTSVLAGAPGKTITFTYTAATGGLTNGAVTVAVPAGWSAPSTTGSAAGFTTASLGGGTVSVSGQTITVSGVTMVGGGTGTIVYGSTTSGGPGATATSTTGAQAWQAQEKSTSGGTLTNLASSPSITVTNAADGSGTLTTPTSSVFASSTGNTITFTYTAAPGGLNNGAVTVVVPAGWAAPSTTGANAGFTTASTGTVGVSGQTITVSGVTLAGGATDTIVYGSTASSGPGATATTTTGAQTWQGQEKSTSGGSLTNLATSPSITVTNSANGSGTLTTATSSVLAGSTGNTITFTYTAAPGGLNSGAVTVVVPSGWSAPSTTSGNAGFTTASLGGGTVSVSGQTITVSGVTLSSGATGTIVYGSGTGATATSSLGAQIWQAQEKSTSGGTLTNLASSPSINVTTSADGSGTLTTPTNGVFAGSTGNTITFTYTAATGGLNNGAVSVVVPAGWTAPSTTGTDPGFTTASTGTIGVSGQTITVSGVTLAGGATDTITYGSKASSGPGATATSTTGAQTWQAQEKSTSGGTLTNLASSPSINVTTSADGSGTLTTPTSSVVANSTGNTITFTYTAASGGLNNGAVTVVVPSGWTAPVTTPTNAAGYTTASTGSVSVSGQTITVSGVTLAGGGTFTIVYGSTASGGPGATATSTTGAQTWQAQEKSTSGGTLTNLAASPSITVAVGTATKLTFTIQPTVGQNIQATGTGSFAVSVAVQDAFGNTVTTDSRSVTLAIGTNPSSGVLSCSNVGGLTVAASSGVANFTGCAITKTGSGYTLTATSSPALTAPGNANSFNITAGTASKLGFTTQPTSGQNIQATGTGSFAASVAVQDTNGNTVLTDSRNVTLAIGTNPSSGALSCSNVGGLTVAAS